MNRPWVQEMGAALPRQTFVHILCLAGLRQVLFQIPWATARLARSIICRLWLGAFFPLLTEPDSAVWLPRALGNELYLIPIFWASQTGGLFLGLLFGRPKFLLCL